MKHILICGAKGVGKSTLIRRLCMDANAPIYGYCTKMLSTADADGLFPIYIHPARQTEAERTYGSANLIGRCDICIRDVYTNVFNTLGAEYITAAKPGGYIIMDELGFMERMLKIQAGRVQRAGWEHTHYSRGKSKIRRGLPEPHPRARKGAALYHYARKPRCALCRASRHHNSLMLSMPSGPCSIVISRAA